MGVADTVAASGADDHLCMLKRSSDTRDLYTTDKQPPRF